MSCPKCGSDIRLTGYRNFSQGPNITIEKYCGCDIELRITFVDSKYAKIDGIVGKVWF